MYFAEVTNNTGCVKFDSVLVPEPDPIAPNDSVTHASCKDSCDGVAWVSPTGGTPGYDYSWTGGVNNPNDSLNTDLCAGNYDITISDANNCDTTRTITVAEPDSLDLADISVTDISCNGADDGSIIIFPDGGTPGYSYQWIDCSTGSPIGQNGQKATNLSPGDYSVIVNDTNGCQKVSECVTVNEPASLTADASVMNNVTCNGDCDGSARVDVNGGTPNYTYEWFDGAGNPVSGGDTTITGLCAGDYYVKVTDVNGCSILSDTVTVTEPAPITLNTDKRDNACNGDCEGMAIVMATGGIPGYNYQWMDAATGNPITGATDDTLRNACAGPYVAKVTDMNGCKELSDTIRIDEPDPLTLNKGSDDISCKDSCDGKVFVDPSGGTPPYSVFWDNGSTADTLDDLCPGTYTVQVTDANGCITIDSITLIEPKPLTATLNADSSTCGDCDGVAEVLPTGGNPSPGYSYEWSPSGQTDQVADSLCAGPHWVQVTAMGSGCRDTFQTTVSDIGSEKLSTDSVDASCEDICDGMAIADFNCTDPGCSIQWFDANTGNPISSATDDTLRNACDGEYFVEVVNNSGCKAVEFVTVGSPVIEANESITSASCKGICDGQISINPSGGAGNYSYQWTDNNGDPMAPQDPENPTGLCKGTYKVVITDAVGCDSTYTFTVPGPPAITGKFSTTNANCGLSDGTATLSNISGGNGGPYGVTWFDDNMDSLNQTGNTAIGLSSGVYNAEVEDATGCTNILAVTVDDSAGHSITVDSISDVSCPEKEDGAIHISVAGGNAPYTYEWSPSGNTDQDLENAPNGSHTVKVTDDTGCTKFLTDTIGKPEPLDVTRNIADASCGACDGSADLTVNGGTSPYTYEWSTGGSGPSETNICPGTHSVQITDAAGCENTIELSIENIEGPTIDGVNSDPVTCANTCDGAGEVFASGAGPLEYFWPSTGSNTNTSTGLCKGIHKVHVTDTNNCSSIAEVPVGGPQAIEDSAVVEHTNCGSCNGSVTAFASGGSPGYSYEWSNGDTSRSTDSLCSGTHTVIITDNAGCQDTASYNVNDSEAPTLSTTVNNVSCNDSCDGSASVSANGGIPPYNFTWLNATGNDTVGQGANISGLCPGDYVIRVEDDSGCATLETITIEEPEAIYFNPSLTRDVSCYGDCDGEATISFNGGTLPFDIQWDNGSDSATSTGLCAGSHKVVIRDDNGCMDSSFVTIDQPDSLTISIDSVLKASCPNTADGRIDIIPNGGTQPYNYTWTGPNGFTSNMEDIDNLLPGKYIITVTDTNGCIRMDSAMVDPEVVVNAYAGQDTSYCEGKGPITLTGSGGTTQEWLDASGNTVGTGNSVIVDPAQTGPNIFVLVDRNGPCTDRNTIIVTG